MTNYCLKVDIYLNVFVFMTESDLSEMHQEAWRHHLNWLSGSFQKLSEEEEEGDRDGSRSSSLMWGRLADRVQLIWICSHQQSQCLCGYPSIPVEVAVLSDVSPLPQRGLGELQSSSKRSLEAISLGGPRRKVLERRKAAEEPEKERGSGLRKRAHK